MAVRTAQHSLFVHLIASIDGCAATCGETGVGSAADQIFIDKAIDKEEHDARRYRRHEVRGQIGPAVGRKEHHHLRVEARQNGVKQKRRHVDA